MRVTYLSGTGELGGAERSLLDILASLRQAQPSWTLRLVTAADGPLVAEASALGVAVTVLPFPRAVSRVGETGAGSSRGGALLFAARLAAAAPPVARYVRTLRGELRSARPEVLHSHSLKMHVIGTWAAPRSAAVIWHLHDYIGARPATARLLRYHARRCAVAVANSQSVTDDARRVLGTRVPIVPILNAVDLERFSLTGRELDLDGLAGLPRASAGVVRVGLIGTFAHWKGHMTFLDAIARLPPALRVRGYVIGGPLYQTDASQHTLDVLRRHAEKVGVSERVGFTGFVARPEDAIRALDIVVHASTAPEPFGLVIAEAMACGRAVIASATGGAREVFTSGLDALSHVPGSADSLAERIAELASDADRRTRIGRAGRQTAERRFDRTRLAFDLMPVYEQALARV